MMVVAPGRSDDRAGETGFEREQSEHIWNSDLHFECLRGRVSDQSGKAGYRYMYSDKVR